MKDIIENVKLVADAPLEEPARQYYLWKKQKNMLLKCQRNWDAISRSNSNIWLSDERSRL